MSEGKKKITPKATKRKTTNRRSKKSPEPPKTGSINFYWIYGIVGISLIAMIFMNSNGGVKEIQFSEFKEYVAKDEIEKVSHDGHTFQVYFNE